MELRNRSGPDFPDCEFIGVHDFGREDSDS